MIRKNTMVSLSAAALLAIPSLGSAQNMSINRVYSNTWGNSDASVNVYANGYASAGLSSRWVSTGGSGMVASPYTETTVAGSAGGRVLADLSFLGTKRRAGEFRINGSALGIQRRYTNGSTSYTTAVSAGSVYLRVGNSVLWNSSFVPYFSGRANVRLQVMVPTLVVPLGAGIAVLNGRAYGRMRAAMDITFNPFAGQARLSGEAAASGDGSATATVISLLVFANASVSFYANEQKLVANSLTANPGIGGATWGRSGSVDFVSGSMRGLLTISAMLPPLIPINSTLANWSKSATTKRLF